MTLLDDAKIITTANAGKAGTLYSVKPDSGLADLDITRATTATRVNPSGNIESVAVNEPQLDYSDGSCPSFLVEPQRTNLFTYSTGMPSGGWAGTATYNANTVVGPDGTTTGNLIEDPSGGASVAAYNVMSVSASTTYTFSFYAKRGTMTDMNYSILDMQIFSYIVGVTSFYSQTNSSTWSRISVTFTTNSGTSSVRIYLGNFAGGTGTNFSLWGVQLEEIPSGAHTDPSATSYIPTSGATVTRNRTSFYKTGLSSLIGQTEGVFFLELDFDFNGDYGFISMGANSSNAVGIGATNSSGLWLQALIGGTGLNTFWSSPGYPSGFFKIAIKYKSGDFAAWLNGTEVTTNASITSQAKTWEKIAAGYGTTGSFYFFYGKIRQIQFYDTILTDAQLLALTT